jgi:hypothetical protein
MATGRTGSSGYVVKASASQNPYLKQNSGFIVTNTGGNLSSQVPRYAAASLNYSGPIKSTSTGLIVTVPR